MTAFQHAGPHPQDGRHYVVQPDEEQQDEVNPQLSTALSARSSRQRCHWAEAPSRRTRFPLRRAPLRPLPGRRTPARPVGRRASSPGRCHAAGRPRHQMAALPCFGQDGQHHPVGVDERDLQHVGQAAPPHRGLAGAIVSRDDHRQRLPGCRLNAQDAVNGLKKRRQPVTLKSPSSYTPRSRLPSNILTILPGWSSSA